jgi:hypothetical protein
METHFSCCLHPFCLFKKHFKNISKQKEVCARKGADSFFGRAGEEEYLTTNEEARSHNRPV